MAIKWHRGNGPKHVAEYFALSEFECKCGKCDLQIIEPILIEKLDALREALGTPIMIHSGYRCEEHNKAVGGKRNSRHLSGKAADISAKAVKIKDMLDLCEKEFQRIGVAKNFIHVDCDEGKAKWYY